MGKAYSISTPEKSTLWGYSLLLMGLTIITAVVFYWQLPPQIPLFYSMPAGTTQLAAREWFWLLPVLAVGMMVLFTIAVRLPVGIRVYRSMVAWLAMLVFFLLLVAEIHIILMVL